ncbi:cupin domain-containing protein [Maricaulis sp.]|uniref:cupin domain-containing protein n=1 Tax=Maricaulis sp. TaxID=1486257 RepID=UPI00260DE4A8|nr:cupin domain-containing protein [Maricaulis sp.]
MELNADFAARAAVHDRDNPWRASPMAGVERKMLDRIGDEVARATSIVRYAPGSSFSRHTHGGGEEFLVLDGVFQDEHGDYPAGSYVRNPPGTSHTPGSAPGCTILVKLWQFDPQDLTQLRYQTEFPDFTADPARPGVQVQPLFASDREDVAHEIWAAASAVSIDTDGGAELYVVEGEFEEAGERFSAGSWLRLPDGYEARITTLDQPVKIWRKTGHLRHIRLPEAG